MFRNKPQFKLVPCAILALALSTAAGRAGVVIRQLGADPTDPSSGAAQLLVEGPGSGRFAFVPGTAAAYPSDRSGSFLAHHDALSPTSRAVATLDRFYTEQDDFVFGAVLAIQSRDFHADPFGFHALSFALLNSTTTGFDRTGDLSDFSADTFDTLDIAYFPQVSPIFGGPFLSPGVFGEAISGDAFSNFAFGTAQIEIPLDRAVVVVAEHRAAEEKLVVTLHEFLEDGSLAPIPGGAVTADLSTITGFAVDSLGVPVYQDGFNIFAPSGQSLNALVAYDRLFFSSGRIGEGGGPRSLEALLHMSERGGDGTAAP